MGNEHESEYDFNMVMWLCGCADDVDKKKQNKLTEVSIKPTKSE